MARSSRKRRDGAGNGGRRTPTAAILFLVLGLVGAFAVSAVAALWGGEEPQPGLQALGPGVDDRASVRVEVLNGAGTPGLARRVTQQLRSDGFDVVYYGNAGRFDHSRSLVLDRTGNPRAARAVAAVLGIDSVATAIDSILMLEVTVVVGDDWPPAPEEPIGWADRVRDLLGDDSVRAPEP